MTRDETSDTDDTDDTDEPYDTHNTHNTHDTHDTRDTNDAGEPYDVLVVGGGVAGLTASVFTARAGLSTVVINEGESIVRRNAHLENVPGFPAGVNSNLFTEMLEAQSMRSGADHLGGRVTDVRAVDSRGDEDGERGRFTATVSQGDEDETETELSVRFVVAASWSDASYLDGLDVEIRDAGSKRYVDDDGLGRTNVDGIYAAGRLSERYHQAVVSAGHGAEVAIALIHDSKTPFYHDWVAPDGYFTDRGRDVPPGCEEISESERQVRERESMAAMQAYFADPHPDRQRTHPSLVDDELGRLPDDGEGD